MSLITDTTPLQQPDNSYPFVLNVINSTKENAVSAISSEPGLTTIHELSSGKSVIGKIYFNNKILVFSTDNTTDNIGVIEDGQYTRVYTGNLNFNKEHKILGEHRVLGGCNDMFYFQDGINPDRYFQLDKIPTDTSLFSMLQITKKPKLDVQINNTGGFIPSSGTSFLIQYTNLNGDVFDQSEPTVQVPVYSDTISPSAQGSITPTQKSATITVSNLDTRFPYIRLVAIHNVEGNYRAYQIDNLIPTSNTVIIEYQGPSDNDIELDNREVQVGQAQYNTSLVSEQVQGRLLRANVQEITEDYSNHQRLVNNIVTLPEIKTVRKTTFTQDPNNQNYTFQSDEVYALSIRFTDPKKQPTPLYHIPGRAPNTADLQTINFNSEEYLRYEIENSAEAIHRSIRGMGYYQTKTNYPDIKDGDGNFIYGTLANTPVRHHRMPSRRTVPLEQGANLNHINLTFTNITIPEGYSDYEIFYVPRTDTNSTILDSGYLKYAWSNGASINESLNFNFYQVNNFRSSVNTGIDVDDYQQEFDVNNPYVREVARFTSPKSFLKQNLKGNYFDIIRDYTIIEDSVQKRYDLKEYDQIEFYTLKLNSASIINQYESYDTNVYIAEDSKDQSSFDLPVINFGTTQVANVYNARARVTGLPKYAVNKRILSPYGNLQSLVYKPLILKESSYQGDTFIYPMVTLTDGITLDQRSIGIPSGGLQIQKYQVDYINNLWVESSVRLFHGEAFTSSDDVDYVVGTLQTNTTLVTPEEYKLNQGYNYGSIKSYFPLQQTYDYSNKCRSANPTRIIYSPQSFQEELSDSYLISNNNDYIDLPANTGPIRGIKYKNGRLYVHTTETTYVLSPNPQYLSTNQLVAQLQTGDFLSIPPQEIIQTDYGYGGLQSKTGTINNEYGYYWIDGLRGSLNGITDTFKSISNNGMMNWFKNNTSTKSEVIMAFDPFYSRLLMTIKNDDACQPYHTLSYHLNSQTFTSFHEYNPEFYLNDSTRFYSTYNNKIKRHNIENNYFHPVIEQVNKNLQTQNLISLTHYTEFFENDNEVIDTFSDLIIYNSNQSSGKLNLYNAGPYDSLFYRPNERPVRIQDKNHNIANIWDNSISSEVTTKPCNESKYTNKKFINTQLEGEHYNKPLFKEKYTIARLSYNPVKDRRMTHYLLQQNKQQSIR